MNREEVKSKNPVLLRERDFWRRHPESNWGIRVLQTRALPLGYVAVSYQSTKIIISHTIAFVNSIYQFYHLNLNL